jgi:hypothetical protein
VTLLLEKIGLKSYPPPILKNSWQLALPIRKTKNRSFALLETNGLVQNLPKSILEHQQTAEYIGSFLSSKRRKNDHEKEEQEKCKDQKYA